MLIVSSLHRVQDITTYFFHIRIAILCIVLGMGVSLDNLFAWVSGCFTIGHMFSVSLSCRSFVGRRASSLLLWGTIVQTLSVLRDLCVRHRYICGIPCLPLPLAQAGVVHKLPPVRLPGGDVDLLEDATGTLFCSNRREGSKQLLDAWRFVVRLSRPAFPAWTARRTSPARELRLVRTQASPIFPRAPALETQN